MPQVITHVSEAYRFDELTDAAKETARDWYRGCMNEDNDLSDRNYDDFVRVAEILGIDFRQRETGQRRDGTKVYGPAIYWSGFCSQGDGACFEGTLGYNPNAPAEIRDYAPQDERLHAIADGLAEIQERNLFGLTAKMTHTGRYYHAYSMTVDVEDERDVDRDVSADGKAICDLIVDFANWMYRQLEADNDYLYSAECVDESIEANEYMFDEEGNRHDYA
jgi:hypothetical protein